MRGAKAVPGDIDAVANDLKNAAPGIIVFTASSGSQFSLEDDTWQNGAFTRALLEAMHGQGDFTQRGIVRVSDLEGYVYERVKVLTHGRQKPLVAKPKLTGKPADHPSWPMSLPSSELANEPAGE